MSALNRVPQEVQGMATEDSDGHTAEEVHYVQDIDDNGGISEALNRKQTAEKASQRKSCSHHRKAIKAYSNVFFLWNLSIVFYHGFRQSTYLYQPFKRLYVKIFALLHEIICADNDCSCGLVSDSGVQIDVHYLTPDRKPVEST